MASEHSKMLLLCLKFREFLDETHSSLIDSLHKSTKLDRAKSSSEAIRYLEAHNPKAILVTDEGLTETTNGAVLEMVQSYVKNGGLVIVIFGLHFPSFTRMDVFDKFFDKGFGLAWQHGDYHRAIFRFNPACTLPAGAAKDSMPLQYSMKALHVKNAEQHEKNFLPVPGGTTQSLVFPPSHVDEAQAAVVGANIGDGFWCIVGMLMGNRVLTRWS